MSEKTEAKYLVIKQFERSYDYGCSCSGGGYATAELHICEEDEFIQIMQDKYLARKHLVRKDDGGIEHLGYPGSMHNEIVGIFKLSNAEYLWNDTGEKYFSKTEHAELEKVIADAAEERSRKNKELAKKAKLDKDAADLKAYERLKKKFEKKKT